MPGAGVGRQIVLAEADFGHRVPRVPDISGCPPKIPTDVRPPLPNIRPPILAKAKHDGTPNLLKRITHLLVNGLHVLVFVDIGCAAPIVLEVIDAPRSVRAGILQLMAITAFISGASVRTG